jgi:hypothetical protein
VYALCGYIAGVHPPGRHLRLLQAGRVLLNMLEAHCAAYAAIKALPSGPSLSVGLVHHHILFMAFGDGCLHALARCGPQPPARQGLPPPPPPGRPPCWQGSACLAHAGTAAAWARAVLSA